MANPIFNLNSRRESLRSALTLLISQIPKQAPEAQFVVDGVTMTGAQYVAQAQQMLDMMVTTDQAHARLHDASVAEDAMRERLRKGGTGLKGYVIGVFGDPSTQLTDLGLTNKPRPAMTVEARASAAEKGRATRVARHTMGRRERAAIHGVVAAPAPSASAPAPSAPAAPAAPSAPSDASAAMTTPPKAA